MSHLLDFDQRALKILGVQEQHRLAVGADLRLAIADDASARRFQAIARGKNVLDLEAHVMQAALGALLQKPRDRRTGAARLQQLDLGVGQIDDIALEVPAFLRRSQ